MKIVLHRNFEKQYSKLPKKIKEQFKARKDIFIQDPYSPTLYNHTLKGKYKHCRSINITGNIRAIYTVKDNVVIFLHMGTHSDLYE